MTVQRLRGAVLLFIATVAGAALTLLSAAPATGHAMLTGTDPADGDVLPTAPDAVVLTFNEPVSVAEDGVRLLTSEAEPLPATASAVDTTVELTVPEDLTDGSYIVDWQVTSADGHPVAGAFTFSVGEPSEEVAEIAPRQTSTVVHTLYQGGQGLIYLGVLGAAGLTMFVGLLLPRGAAAVVPRLRSVAMTLAGVGAAGVLLSVLVDGAWRSSAGSESILDASLLSETITSATGLAAGLALLGLAGAMLLFPQHASGRRRWAACGGALLALASLTLTGHTRTTDPAWLVVGSDLVHVVAGSLWLGGILGLLAVCSSTSLVPELAARVVRSFSGLAAWLVLALGVTGTLLAWRILPDLDSLTSTGWGVTLIAKVALVVIIVLVAAWNRFRLVPSIAAAPEGTGRSRLRKTVATEGVLLVVVLAVTAFLVIQSPTEADEAGDAGEAGHGDEQTGHGEPAVYQEALGDAGTVEIQVHQPGAGENLVELELLDPSGAPLEPEADPELRLSEPEAELGPLVPGIMPVGPGHYQAPVTIPIAGDWELEVTVRVSTYESPIVTVTVPIE